MKIKMRCHVFWCLEEKIWGTTEALPPKTSVISLTLSLWPTSLPTYVRETHCIDKRQCGLHVRLRVQVSLVCSSALIVGGRHSISRNIRRE